MLTTIRRQVRDTAYPRFERQSTAIVPGTGAEVGVNEPRYVGGNYSLRFDGVDDFVLIDGEDLPETFEQVAFAGWFNARVFGKYQRAISRGDALAGSPQVGSIELSLSSYSDCRIFWGVNGDKGFERILYVASDISASSWFHLCGTYDGSRLKLFINGVERATVDADLGSATRGTSKYIVLGRRWSGNSDYFDGMMDDVRVYNVGDLTETQVQTIMQGGHIGVNPVVQLGFDEGHGTTAHDTAERINLLPLNVANGGEDGTITGLFRNGNGVEVTVTSEDVYEGQRCICVNADGNFDWQGIITSNIPTVPGKWYTASAWIKGTAGEKISFRFRRRANVNDYKNYTFVMNGSWQYVRISSVMNEVDGYRTHLRVDLGQKKGRPITFYVDALMFHEGDADIPFVLPKETPYNGEIVGAVFDQDNPFFEQGGFGHGVMVEEGTTNAFTTVDDWRKENGSVSGGHPGPFGTSDAWLYTENTETNTYRAVRRSNVVTGFSNVAMTVYAKARGRRYVWFGLTNTGASENRVWFDLIKGVVSYQGSVWLGADIQHVGDGWYRCRAWRSGTEQWCYFGMSPNNEVIHYDGDGSSGVYMWGFQVENKPYPTSFTTGTRAPESLRIPTAGVLSAERGQIDVDVLVNDLVKNASGNNRIWELATSSGASKGYAALYHVHDHKVWSIITYNGSESASLSIPSGPYDGVCRFTVKWEKDRLSLLINGVLVNSRSSQRIPVDLRDFWIYLGRRPNNIGYINTSFYGFRILSTPMSDDEIAAEYGKPLSVTPTTTYLLDFNRNLRQQQGTTYLPRYRGSQAVVL